MMWNLSPEAQALAFFQQNAPATDHSQDREGALAQLLSLGPSNCTKKRYLNGTTGRMI